jgi:erythromycin esterase-like protein
MLWAHNGHVSTAELGSSESMGGALPETYGAQMVVCGFAFGEGTTAARENPKYSEIEFRGGR